MSRVLVIGDIHAPAEHPGYLDFVTEIGEQWDCDRVHFIGDIVDHHAISFHAHHPDAPGPKDEKELAQKCIDRWYKRFPKATVNIGNHDARIIRLAETVNIPSYYLRDYADVWNTPGWTWHDEVEIDGVIYRHGTGCGGLHPAYNLARASCCSVAIGHVHSAAGVSYLCGPRTRIFGVDVGCGVDDRHIAMSYGKDNVRKSIIACAVIIDGTHAISEICPCGPGERFNRSHYKGGK